ncbi:hypothetical protein BGX27_010923 [Mortierella sp. AM989]|nr:hypothetical protein BGX27_010923 [Mortierella sp. AM989]
MRFSSASLVAAAFAFALTFADIALAVDPNDPVVKACLRKCDVEQAKGFETAVKNYPNPRNAQRLRDIFSLTFTLLLAGTLALSSTAEAGQSECDTRCQVKLSYAVEKCIKKFPVTDSDARLDCNKPPVETERKCEARCRKTALKCFERCLLKANADWEPCVTKYKDPKDSRRIQCINDVEDARHKCYVPCQ